MEQAMQGFHEAIFSDTSDEDFQFDKVYSSKDFQSLFSNIQNYVEKKD